MLIKLVFAILLLLLQRFLSTREQVWFGAIFPAVYLIGVGGLIIANKLQVSSFDDSFILILVLFILLGLWAEGRDRLKRQREKELEKIKSQDMI